MSDELHTGSSKEQLTKSQIDRLGERLKEGRVSDDDLRLLDSFKRTFGGAYEHVIDNIRGLGHSPTGRRAKTDYSIIEKLRVRVSDSVRCRTLRDAELSCRTSFEQDKCVVSLVHAFPHAAVIDRREKPSHGYRAVHIIPKVDGLFVEIQLRTVLQDMWAQTIEALSDRVDPAIKYGGGEAGLIRDLIELSNLCASIEEIERSLLVAILKKLDLVAKLLGERERIETALKRLASAERKPS